MSVITDESIGKVETSPGRRTMKVRAQQPKRGNHGSQSIPILLAMIELAPRNDNPRLCTTVKTSTWILPTG
jgi:hypothetical protein